MGMLNVEQAARAAGCSPQTVHRWLKLGKMAGVQDAAGQWTVTSTKEELMALPIRRLKKRQAALLKSKSRNNGHAPANEKRQLVLALARLSVEERDAVIQLAKKYSVADLTLLFEPL